jgi:hypothetical protein
MKIIVAGKVGIEHYPWFRKKLDRLTSRLREKNKLEMVMIPVEWRSWRKLPGIWKVVDTWQINRHCTISAWHCSEGEEAKRNRDMLRSAGKKACLLAFPGTAKELIKLAKKLKMKVRAID